MKRRSNEFEKMDYRAWNFASVVHFQEGVSSSINQNGLRRRKSCLCSPFSKKRDLFNCLYTEKMDYGSPYSSLVVHFLKNNARCLLIDKFQFVCLGSSLGFTSSPIMAPPMMHTAPRYWIAVIFSPSSRAANSTADRGSR